MIKPHYLCISSLSQKVDTLHTNVYRLYKNAETTNRTTTHFLNRKQQQSAAIVKSTRWQQIFRTKIIKKRFVIKFSAPLCAVLLNYIISLHCTSLLHFFCIFPRDMRTLF